MHVDEFIEYGITGNNEEEYARWVLNHFRLSAVLKNTFRQFMEDSKLFCSYEGKKYRVTGASRLGDIWLTRDFEQDIGYQLRVDVEKVESWSFM